MSPVAVPPWRSGWLPSLPSGRGAWWPLPVSLARPLASAQAGHAQMHVRLGAHLCSFRATRRHAPPWESHRAQPCSPGYRHERRGHVTDGHPLVRIHVACCRSSCISPPCSGKRVQEIPRQAGPWQSQILTGMSHQPNPFGLDRAAVVVMLWPQRSSDRFGSAGDGSTRGGPGLVT